MSHLCPFKADEAVIEIQMMLKLLLYQDVTDEDLFSHPHTWSEVNLFFSSISLVVMLMQSFITCSITSHGWLNGLLFSSSDIVYCFLFLERV